MRNPVLLTGVALVVLAFVLSATVGADSAPPVLSFCAGGALIGVGFSQQLRK